MALSFAEKYQGQWINEPDGLRCAPNSVFELYNPENECHQCGTQKPSAFSQS